MRIGICLESCDEKLAGVSGKISSFLSSLVLGCLMSLGAAAVVVLWQQPQKRHLAVAAAVLPGLLLEPHP